MSWAWPLDILSLARIVSARVTRSSGSAASLLCAAGAVCCSDRRGSRAWAPARFAALNSALRSMAPPHLLGQLSSEFSAQRQLLSPQDPSLRQLVEQGLGLLEVKSVEALCEGAMDRSEKVAGLRSPALIAAEPRHAYRRSQLPGLCLLFARDLKCTLETGLRLFHVRLRQKQCDF